MARTAPLRITVQIHLPSAESTGLRCLRLSETLRLPPELTFRAALPIDESCTGAVSFELPGGGGLISVAARLHFDPQRPERGSVAQLVGLDEIHLRQLEAYVSARTRA